MNKKDAQIEKIVDDYFGKLSYNELTDVVELYCYEKPNKTDRGERLLNDFLSKNSLLDIYKYWTSEEVKTATFTRSRMEATVLATIQRHLVWLHYQETRKQLSLAKKQIAKEKREKKKKNEGIEIALECYESLNRSECYFEGEKEDNVVVTTLEKLLKL